MSGTNAPPTYDNAPAGDTVRGVRVLPKTEHELVADPHGEDHVFDALAARAATAGCTLRQLSGGGYLLSRWSLARGLPDLRAVSSLLSAMGVRA